MGNEEDAKALARAIQQSVEKLMEMVLRRLERDNAQSKEAELSRKMLKGHGPVMGSSVIKEHSDRIREELIKQNIPFLAIKNPDGDLFLVRKGNESKLLDIEAMVSATDTRLAKELNPVNGLTIAKSQGLKHMTTLSFNDPEMAEIAKQKLFQSGQTFIATKNGAKTILSVFPDSLYKPSGKDLELFKLNYCLLQARDRFKEPGEIESELLSVRKAQAAFDKDKIETFIKAAKKGEHVVLGDNRGNGNLYIEAIKGQIYVINRSAKTETPIQYYEKDSIEDISATLSRYTEDIFNMNVIEGDYYNEVLKTKTVRRDELKEPYNKYSRPAIHGDNPYSAVHSIMSGQCELLVQQINYEATKRVEATKGNKFMSTEKLAELKHKEIEQLLKDEEFEPIKQFLNPEDDRGVDKETRRQILDDLTENYTNESQNTRYSVDVEHIRIKELETLIVEADGKIEQSPIKGEPEVEVSLSHE